MNILIVLNDLDIGGSQNYTISLANEFQKLGHKVDLRVLSSNIQLKSRISENIIVEVWPRKRKLEISVLNKIRNEIKSKKYNAIISTYDLYIKISTLFLNIEKPIIYPLHTTQSRNLKDYLFTFLLFHFKRKNEIYLTSIDNQTKYLTTIFKLKTDFFKQIYNGIDTEKFTLPPDSFNKILFLQSKGINPKHKIILMVAGYREEKRHIDAINAFKMLQTEFKDVSLVCVGDNRKMERDELQKNVDHNNIENVKLFIASEAGDVRNFYWSSDVFTLTSNKVETFPLSSLEAMASGLPCILTNIGGAKNIIIQNINGILCEPRNILDIKTKWAHMLYPYIQYNKNHIRNTIIEKYSIIRAANDYLRLIEEC